MADLTVPIDLTTVQDKNRQKPYVVRQVRQAASPEKAAAIAAGDWTTVLELSRTMPTLWIEVLEFGGIPPENRLDNDISQSLILGVQVDETTVRNRKVSEMPFYHTRTVSGVVRHFFLGANPRRPETTVTQCYDAFTPAQVNLANTVNWTQIIGLTLPEADPS